jgi:hypothetical protein
MAREHKIPSLRIGRVFRFTVESLDAWLAKAQQLDQTTVPAAPELRRPVVRPIRPMRV